MEEQKEFLINSCSDGHFFIDKLCPFCGKISFKSYPFQEGDCISCGSLCPDYGYKCNSPVPLTEEDFVK